MKVLWIVLGVLFGLCLICGGVGYFIFNKSKGLVQDVLKYGDESFSAIATNWDETEFQKRAPDIEPAKGKALMEQLRTKLGPLKGTFTSHMTKYNMVNGTTNADWISDATFEKGTGHVTMELLNKDGKWSIQRFDVESDALKAADTSGTVPDEPNVTTASGTTR